MMLDQRNFNRKLEGISIRHVRSSITYASSVLKSDERSEKKITVEFGNIEITSPVQEGTPAPRRFQKQIYQ